MAKTSGSVRGGGVKSYTYNSFQKERPILYGSIMVNGREKIGMFRAEYNPYSNKQDYRFYSPQGNKGQGGFTIDRAFALYQEGRLSLKPIEYVGKKIKWKKIK